MEAAEKLYLEMVDRDAEDPGFLNTPHIFTILISGHVRHGNIQEALSIYKEMTDRGITGATPERVIRTLRVGMAKLPEVEATRLEQVLNTIVADAFPGDSAKLGLGMDIGPRHRSSSP
jgi:pentatricopeptide repeat protein